MNLNVFINLVKKINMDILLIHLLLSHGYNLIKIYSPLDLLIHQWYLYLIQKMEEMFKLLNINQIIIIILVNLKLIKLTNINNNAYYQHMMMEN